MDHPAKSAATRAASILAARTTRTRDELLYQRDALIDAEPGLHGRALAERLGISEAQLVLLDHGRSTRLLSADWPAILGQAHELGTVMAFTRNAFAMHEKIGRYGEIIFENDQTLAIGEEINVRLLIDQWGAIFAVRDGTLRSLQFFNRFGDAVHKIYLLDDSDIKGFDRLVEAFGCQHSESMPRFEQRTPFDIRRSINFTVDAASFRSDWDSLRGLHDFPELLRRYRLRHADAFRLIGEQRARRLPASAFRRALEIAARAQTPLVVQIENCGAIQMHAGPVANVSSNGRWLNIIDATFNFHMLEEGLRETWAVNRPASDGPVLALEVIDLAGNSAASIFGLGQHGSNSNDWPGIVGSL